MNNPLDAYRRAQRALRKEFDAFTSVHCATCPSPCCRKPARITPTDILLAQGCGWKPRSEFVGRDLVAEAASESVAWLKPESESPPTTPCDHLGERGCTFPSDLRPFGCTTYICPIMYERLDRKALARIRRLIREVERCHEGLMAALHRHGDGRSMTDDG